MFRVPSPHVHGTILHAPHATAAVLDGYAVHESEDELRHVAEVFGLGDVEHVDEPTPEPVDHWTSDGGAPTQGDQ